MRLVFPKRAKRLFSPSTMKLQCKGTHLWTRKKGFARSLFVIHPHPELISLHNCGNKTLLFKGLLVYRVSLDQAKWTKTVIKTICSEVLTFDMPYHHTLEMGAFTYVNHTLTLLKLNFKMEMIARMLNSEWIYTCLAFFFYLPRYIFLNF